ncbi:MAG: PD-(D/E)XK nuclease family protein [Actinomycetaceae bacterium]|nr:PD-(D/E)XK nuclease family protein [Actinomycetaceae bacterium]MDU0970194.1 PD-(D/E)XK nuclease family protein [Actinomycetaceae bacterium]
MSEKHGDSSASDAEQGALSPVDDDQAQPSVAEDLAAQLRQGTSVVVHTPTRSGKTTLAAQVAVLLGQQAPADLAPIILVPTRRRRDLLERRSERLQMRAPHPIHTPASLAFSVLTQWATQRALPQPAPTLLTGADQDAVVAQLLADHAADSPFPPESLTSDAFRLELRNLFARCGDFGVGSGELAQWGRDFGVDAWAWVAPMLAEYDAMGPQLDTERCQDAASRVLADWDRRAKEEGVGAPRPEFPYVIVDDMQDMTGATSRLLAQLHALGSRLLVFTSPEQAVDVHRGARPDGAHDLVQTLQNNGGDVSSVTWSPEQAPVAAPQPERSVFCYATAFDQAQGVANLLQRRHLFDGVDYADMAVIVRENGMIAPFARYLERGGVRVDASSRRMAPMGQPITRALIDLVTVAPLIAAQAPGGAAGEADQQQEEQPNQRQVADAVHDVLTSVVVGLSGLDISRLARAYVAGLGEDIQSWSVPGVADLVPLVASPQAAQTFVEHADAQVADAAARLALAARLLDVASTAASQPPLEGLWALWDATGLAQPWREQALAGDRQANDDLDDAVSLFRFADFWTQRNPGLPLRDFAAYVAELAVPVDTVAPAAQRVGGVALLTPSQAAGRTFDTVVIASLHEDVWPNLAVRDSALRADLLADIATGRVSPEGGAHSDPLVARDATARDERRMFTLARSRATSRLILTAVDGPDSQPSRYLYAQWRDLPAGKQTIAAGQTRIPITRPEHPLTARALAGEMRRQLIRAQRLVDGLTLLASAGEEAAIPRRWTGMSGGPAERTAWPTSTAPVYPPERRLRVSPSKISSVLDCPLMWFLQSTGGSGPGSDSQTMGSIVHKVAEEYQAGDTADDMVDKALGLWYQSQGSRGYAARQQADKLTHRIRALHDFLSTRSAPAAVETEITHSLDAGGKTLVHGYIDRIEYGDDGPQIFDFKTGASPVSYDAAAAHPQLLAYQLALSALEGDTAGASLIYLTGEKDTAEKPRSQPGLAQALEEEQVPAGLPDDVRQAVTEPGGVGVLAKYYVAEAVSRFRSDQLPATTGKACDHCPVRTSCPAVVEGERTLS